MVLVLLISLLAFTSLSVAAPPPGQTQTQPDALSSTPPYEVLEVEQPLTSFDGTQLPMSVFYPGNAGQGETFPLIVFVHPWCMEKSLFESWAREYAARGYVCVTFTARGWFGAGGSINTMDPQHEIRDLSCLITAVSDDSSFPVLRDEKGPVVGVTGYSMGGCFSYLIAPRADPAEGDPGDPRVRAVVPLHGGADLLYSIYPNNTVKLFWVVTLVLGAYGGNFAGLLLSSVNLLLDNNLDAWQKLSGIIVQVQKMGSVLSNVSPDLAWIATVAMQRSESAEEEAKQYMRVRSARYWCDQEMDGVIEHPITVPTLMLAGWQDDLFYANESMRIFSTCMDAPARLIITNHGHIGGMVNEVFEGMPLSAEAQWISGEVEQWFDCYLKGVDNGVEDEPRLVYYRTDALGYGEAQAYPLAGTGNVSYYLGDGAGGRADLATAAPQGGFAWPDYLINTGITGSISLPYIQDATQLMGGEVMDMPRKIDLVEIPYSECSFTSDPLASDVEIMGAPLLEIYYQSQQRFCQLIPFLYEVGPDGKEVLVSRGWYEGQKLTPWSLNSTAAKPVEMQAVYHRFKAGSRIRLEIATADLMESWSYWGFNFIVLPHGAAAPSRIVLPVVSSN